MKTVQVHLIIGTTLVALNTQSVLMNVKGVDLCTQLLPITVLIVCSTNRFLDLFRS